MIGPAFLVSGMLLVATSAFAVDITRCGHWLFRGEVGVLQNDLTCPGLSGTCALDQSIACNSPADCPEASTCLTGAPYIEKGATLHLNGHAILTGGDVGGVYVIGSGTIRGPGTITAPDHPAISVLGKGRLRVSDLEIRDSKSGIFTNVGARIEATNLIVHDIAGRCIDNSKRVTGTNLTISRCGTDDATYSSWPQPVEALFRAGIAAVSVTIDGLVALDNGGVAVTAKTARIVNGTLGGNDADGSGYDILTFRRPRMLDTVCNRSGQLGYGPPSPVGAAPTIVVQTWGVCAGD